MRHAHLLAYLLVISTVRSASAAADEWDEPRIEIGVLAGVTEPDPDLADYRWDVSARPTLGVQALAGWGRWSAGPRVWRMQSTQSTGMPGEDGEPTVTLTGVALVGEVDVLHVLGARLSGSLSAGRLHLGYEPDRVTYAVAGSSEPIEVRYDPIDEWIVAAGAVVRRSLVGALSAGMQIDHTWFGLDTAHRRGDEIELQRRGFGNWGARLQLGWRWTGL